MFVYVSLNVVSFIWLVQMVQDAESFPIKQSFLIKHKLCIFLPIGVKNIPIGCLFIQHIDIYVLFL